MKTFSVHGLERIPKLAELVRAADQLQSRRDVEPRDLALYTQWSRFDPRFAEILVDYCANHWRFIQFGQFVTELERNPWPFAAVVILRFAAMAVNDRQLDVMTDALVSILGSPSFGGLFFVPLQWPNKVITRNELKWNAEVYARAGFIGSQALLPKGAWPPERTHLTPSARKLILNNLLTDGRSISVADYRAACENSISLRQAQRDLASHAQASGFTRGRRYRGKR